MTSREIENNLIELVKKFNQDDFIYDLLLAYGITKSTVTLLKKGSLNLAKDDNTVFLKKKVFFKVLDDNLLEGIDNISKDQKVIKQKTRFVIVTDYKTLLAKDLKTQKGLKTTIEELPKHYGFFLPLAGSEKYNSKNDNKADRDAAYQLGQLFDILIEDNPGVFNTEKDAHNLNVFLSRLLFCFFAEDTDIFPTKSMFTDTLEQYTAVDGKDTNSFLNRVFEKLNTEDKYKDNYPSHIAEFPYVNGGLFNSKIQSPKFSKKSRSILIDCGDLDWSEINPDIFGSMIQAVVRNVDDDNTKHYTSVPNILKVIKPLFLDELYQEFEKSRDSISKLKRLIHRMSTMKFFDPACGSGNFLIIAYKEIRALEIEIIKQIVEYITEQGGQMETYYTSIQLNQFYGIELDDFAHEMAILSLWLAEHQMNMIFEEQLFDYGRSKPILPLKEAGKIVCDNAARVNWNEVCPIDFASEVYILGNPPYEGARKQSPSQKRDMDFVFRSLKKYRDLDYINIWFYKGAKYINGFNAKCALVSTNSICQGQQVPLIWPFILDKVEIDFAYESFKWTNNAKGNAGVTVIIIGLRNISKSPKYIFSAKLKKNAKNINPYLMDAPNIFVFGRRQPISKLPHMRFGNMPNDGGGLIFSEEEKISLESKHPSSKKFLKQLLGSYEFINGHKRYCLWIEDEDLDEAIEIPEIKNRIEITEKHRLKSKDEGTNRLAKRSHQFRDRHVAKDSLLVIPSVSSERREYIPCGYLDRDTIISNSAQVIYDAEPYVFAIVNSKIHMTWVRAVGGKLKTDYRYSKDIIYNNFPFPIINEKKKELLNDYVFDVLDARAKYPEKTLAWLYNPETMPIALKKAHNALDFAIEQCYKLKPFDSDAERLEHLFKLYQEMINSKTLFAKQKKKRKSKK